MVNVNSQYYPYSKVYEGFSNLADINGIPRKIMDYLLDMPDGSGYVPKDDNKYARCRLWKYLYYDGARPLDNPLPTPKQKREVLFNPEQPENAPNKEKGYRLIPQIYIKPAQDEAQTRIYTYMGNTVAESDFKVQVAVVFEVWTHYTQESNTKMNEAYSRLTAITQAIMEAFHGVNMVGVGSFYYNRSKHPDCRDTIISDNNVNIGRRLVLGIELDSTTPNGNEEFNEIPFGDGTFLG